MKKTCHLLLCAELLLGASVFATTPEIKLSGAKDRVLTSKARLAVLDVAETYLNRGDDRFLVMAAELQTPFVPEPEAVAKAPEAVAGAIQDTETVVYDDASVLEAIGLEFANQVRGTLEKSGRSYLQLQGGGLLKSGTSFPASVPEIEGQTFTVTVTEISSRGYTLRMGEHTLPVSFSGSTGVTKDSSQ